MFRQKLLYIITLLLLLLLLIFSFGSKDLKG